MKNSKTALALTGIMTAVVGPGAVDAVASPASAQSTDSHAHPAMMAALNAGSLRSIESSWLEVPRTCKGRGFHADAQTIAPEALSADAAAVYAASFI